jgi:hypothetical protein
MKAFTYILYSLFLSINLNAQVVKSVHVISGCLSNSMTKTELNTVTDLTITGSLNFVDFIMMRDSMPVLSKINISGVNIAPAKLVDAKGNIINSYPANEIPAYAFYRGGNAPGKTTLTSITLPLSLKTIGECSFRQCDGLSSVIIPSNVDSIKNYAFEVSLNLKTVNIPSSVTFIGNYAFYRCLGLDSINISPSITNIGEGAFQGCGGKIIVDNHNVKYASVEGVLFNKKLNLLIQCPNSKSSYSIPSMVDTIGLEAFRFCYKLKSITIPNTVKWLSFGAFEASGLISVSIPSSITKVTESAFFFCDSLTTVSITSSTDSIGPAAFYHCISLTQVNLPATLKYIGPLTFAFCSRMPSITLPASIKTITFSTFEGCTGLTTITLPTSLTHIQSFAFSGCTSLSSISIPSSVNIIEEGTFNQCTGLTTIHANAVLPVDLSASSKVFYNVPKNTCLLFVPHGSQNLYESATQWKDFLTISEDQNVGIETPSSPKVEMHIENGELVLIGISPGELVTVFNTNGSIVCKQMSGGDSFITNLPSHGVYIVNYKMNSYKLAY